MNLQQLEYIIALEKHRHFGKAAEHCNVSQPTLSTMIQKLEEELGAKLFDRSHQPIRPTAVGLKVLAQACVILRQASVLTEIVLDESDSLTGKISLGILPTIAPYLLPRLIPILLKRLPDLQISFEERLTSECLEGLGSGTLDLAIIASEPPSQDISSTPLYYEEFFGYVSRQEALFAQPNIRSSEVDPSRLWLLDEGHCFRDQLTRFCQLRRSVNPQHQYYRGSLNTFMNMVEGGYGMTFIPELAVSTLSQDHKDLVRPFTIPRPTRLINLSNRVDFARGRIHDILIECIQQAVPKEMHQLKSVQSLI